MQVCPSDTKVRKHSLKIELDRPLKSSLKPSEQNTWKVAKDGRVDNRLGEGSNPSKQNLPPGLVAETENPKLRTNSSNQKVNEPLLMLDSNTQFL